ncbi:MAG: phosphate acyltransferase [Proteobacteria bacterium]|jgi:phosphate butyryltransferase|nr:phosphate acyltransferase [Pseudomonadota bacterium]
MRIGFDELAARIRARDPRTLVVVGAEEGAVLAGVARAAAEGIARPLLVGDRGAIEHAAGRAGVELGGFPIEDVRDPEEMVLAAMRAIGEGRADALMKGRLSTPELMRVGLKHGLKRPDRLLSHLTLFDHPRFDRLVAMTDGGVVPFPSFAQRVEILKNAVDALRRLGVARPRIAGLSSTEVPDERIPSSLEMARLKELFAPGGELAELGEFDGPMDLFCALDACAAGIKGRGGCVVGRADVLHCPDVVAGNLMGKAMLLFAEGMRSGGCVVGGAVPIVLLSRASSPDDKYCSIVAALSCAAP